MTRIHLLVCAALLLVAGTAFATQDMHMQFTLKDYPISEEFLSVVKTAGQEDPVLGKAGDYLVKKSDVDRLFAYSPPETQGRLRKNPAEMQTLVRRMPEVKIIAHAAGKEKFDQIPLA